MKWQFSEVELEQIESKFISRSGAAKLLNKVRQSGIFPFADMHEHPDDPGYWVITVRDPDNKTLASLNNMYHFKRLCLRNGINLKALLLKNRHLDPDPQNHRGFKTVGRLPSSTSTNSPPNLLPPKKFEDML